MDQSIKNKSIAALVLGIASVVLAFIPIVTWFSLPAGIVGVVLAAMAMKGAKAAGMSSGMAIAGLVLSIIGLVIWPIVLLTVGCAACVACQAASALGSLAAY